MFSGSNVLMGRSVTLSDETGSHADDQDGGWKYNSKLTQIYDITSKNILEESRSAIGVESKGNHTNTGMFQQQILSRQTF